MKYQVIDTNNESWDFGNPFVTSATDAEDAVRDYLEYQDSRSWFSEGYPHNWVYEVKDEYGDIYSFCVETDWRPTFYIGKN